MASERDAVGSHGLDGIRVVDFSSQLAGPYCTKLFVDAGAEVIKVEAPTGDPLRRWTASGSDLGDTDSALFTYLNAGKRSVVGEADDAHVSDLIAQCDLLIEAHGLESDSGPRLDVPALRAKHPSLVVVTITPYGLEGPWADRRATEFTLQAECGSISMRGVGGKQPFQAGGRITEWAAGSIAASAALAAVFQARATGRGEHIDLSLLEVGNFVFTNFSDTMNRLMNGSAGDPEHGFLATSVETPSIEPTADGYVGFCTNSKQQFLDFLLMIERPDLQEDDELTQFAGRVMRFDEWNGIMHPWLAARTTAEIVEHASLLRIPVSPVGNGETLPAQEQLVARNVFGRDAAGRFLQPRRPYRIDDQDPPRPSPAPRLGADTDGASFHSERQAVPTPPQAKMPLEGIRVLDMTAWWAGPSATHILAALGAEVIHVESAGRPDGMRMIGGMMAAHYSEWWEASPHFLQANSNKLGITLDLTTEEGRDLIEQLITKCDAIVENYTPRVFDNFGLSWDRVHELNPQAILMRMPAFGLGGPWRDRTGFAQTMEQLSGMAWITGHPDDQPRIPRGPCDPIAGAHGAFALLVTLAERVHSKRGHHVESTMVESALNVAAEQLVDFSAYGHLMQRDGNRSVLAAPQGLYPCAGGVPGNESWLAISIATDSHWNALRDALGNPAWAEAAELQTAEGRRNAHDTIDEHLEPWTRKRPADEIEADLRGRGIPASAVASASFLYRDNPQLQARRFPEALDHPVVGPMPLPTFPFRFASVDRWFRSPAPTVGRDNERVLGGLLGLSAEQLEELETKGVIATRPAGL